MTSGLKAFDDTKPKSGKPSITLVFKDGDITEMEIDANLSGLTDESGGLSHLDKVLAKLKCNECETVDSITIDSIEDVLTERREMGAMIFYSCKGEHRCSNCENAMTVDIEITTYAYDTDFSNYESTGCKLA